MEKKIMIVQSVPAWIGVFQNIILQEYPRYAKDVIYTDSFDEAVSLTPMDCELVVISCDVFSDRVKTGSYKTVIPDSKKDGTMLAKIIKKLNPNTKFYVFSKYPPVKSEFVDDFVPRHQYGDMQIQDALSVLDKIQFLEKTSFIY